MGIYHEKHINPYFAGLLVLLTTLIIFLPWMTPDRELFRTEGLFATEAREFNFHLPVVTAHHAAIRNAYPLFPAMAAALERYTHIPMESVLRLISLVMFCLSSVVVYFGAKSAKDHTAGIVSCALYLSTFFAMEKVIDGVPETTCAFFLISAQLTFFHYGIRKYNWNLAWPLTALFLGMGFLAGGFKVLWYFILPMFFFRRPLSVKSKFSKPSFWIGVVILLIFILIWLTPFWIASTNFIIEYIWDRRTGLVDYLIQIVEFPFLVALRFLPWSIIGWLPFCVALQSLDKVPIYSKYLRTLTFTTLASLWLLPDYDSRELIYLAAPLAIQTGIFYELGMRRYGIKLRKKLYLAEIFSFLLVIAIIGVYLIPDNWIPSFISLSNSLDFRKGTTFITIASISCVSLILIGILTHLGKKTFPVWLILLGTSLSYGIFYGSVQNPYKAQIKENGKKELGKTIKNALAKDNAKNPILYKLDIVDLYGELYYADVKPIKIKNLTELPKKEKTIYILTTKFPQIPERSWTNLLGPGFQYNNNPLALWKGVLRDE
jgi:hypothetical protein